MVSLVFFQLTIGVTLRDHEGSYTCLAVNKAGSLDVDIALEVICESPINLLVGG